MPTFATDYESVPCADCSALGSVCLPARPTCNHFGSSGMQADRQRMDRLWVDFPIFRVSTISSTLGNADFTEEKTCRSACC